MSERKQFKFTEAVSDNLSDPNIETEQVTIQDLNNWVAETPAVNVPVNPVEASDV